jgi:hypothetical protein
MESGEFHYRDPAQKHSFLDDMYEQTSKYRGIDQSIDKGVNAGSDDLPH